MLSSMFIGNRWTGLFGRISLLRGQPIDNMDQSKPVFSSQSPRKGKGQRKKVCVTLKSSQLHRLRKFLFCRGTFGQEVWESQ